MDFHSLRRTFATYLDHAQGRTKAVYPSLIAQLMGHEKPNLALSAYSGVLAEAQVNVVRSVQSEIENLDEEIAQHRRKIDEITSVLPRLLDERDRLSTELAAFGGGSLALVEELLRDEERLRSEADRLVEELMHLLAGDVALALSGSGLRQSAVLRLPAETERKAWESGRDQ